MKTKKLDVVYFVKESGSNPELIYSVRSICKNLQFKHLWFIGGCPQGILPDFYQHFERISSIKTHNTRKMFEVVCEIDEISEDFIFFNDDFFVMRPTDEILPRWYGTLEDKAALTELMYGTNTRWSRALYTADEELYQRGYATCNFELHVPMIFNKKKLKKIIKEFPNTPCKRSLYGNYYELYKTGVERPDGKIHSLELTLFNNDFLSTDDRSFKKGEIGRYIKQQFPNPSKYEI